MKKIILGAIALIVPMALVLSTMYFVGGLVVTLLGLLTIAAMSAYTANKFRMIGHCRGYNKMADAFKYASVGDAFWAFGYSFLIFCGAKIFVDGFDPDPCRFSPLMAVIVYMCGLGVIACVAYLLKYKAEDMDKGMDRKALFVFLTMFLLCIAMGCFCEILKSYVGFTPDSESLSVVLMLAA